MDYSGEAAEQVVRMSLNGVEVAAKISGKAAERLAVLLYAILKEQKRTRGKIRLANMLRSGKELKVFAVKDSELQKFCEEAKEYGVLYCVLKDNEANDGLTDIMVRAEDASKINRIFERFNLATVDMGSVQTEIETAREAKAENGDEIPVPERTQSEEERLDYYLDAVIQEVPDPNAERSETENPTMARTAKSRLSEPSSENKAAPDGAGESDLEDQRSRPSVKEELKEIREEQKKMSEGIDQKAPELEHIPVPAKKKGEKEEIL